MDGSWRASTRRASKSPSRDPCAKRYFCHAAKQTTVVVTKAIQPTVSSVLASADNQSMNSRFDHNFPGELVLSLLIGYAFFACSSFTRALERRPAQSRFRGRNGPESPIPGGFRGNSANQERRRAAISRTGGVGYGRHRRAAAAAAREAQSSKRRTESRRSGSARWAGESPLRNSSLLLGRSAPLWSIGGDPTGSSILALRESASHPTAGPCVARRAALP